jgi:AraC-like DNA-binding protein
MQHPQPFTLKEIRSHGTKSFPCAFYRTRSARTGTLVKHHWHDEVEILYFSGGSFLLDINMEPFSIDSESLWFINPGELHSIVTSTPDSQEDAVVFSPDLLCFDTYDTAQVQLIQPIQKGRMLFPRCITPNHPAFYPIRDAFMSVFHSFRHTCQEETDMDMIAVTDDLTSQLYIKSSLLSILAVLSEHHLFTPTEKNYDKRVEDIKTILTYIKDNYKEKIYISDLAEQVSLNEQYFCRFFKKAIGRTPMEYVNEYRIKQTRRLLEETDLPVTEVCLECGYNNMGNFLREFRRQTGATPLQYRKQYQRTVD